MKNRDYLKFASLAGALAFVPVGVSGQSIVHHAGGADLTFFYDSSGNSFDVVFRSKAGTVADGLTSPYGPPPGGAGGPNPGEQDWHFSSLTASLPQAPWVELNGINYLVSPASGQDYSDTSNAPDLGIRTRFRETDGVNTVDQFSSFTMTLDWVSSVAPVGADFALFAFDELGSPIIRYETADLNFTEDWSVWGHDHWHWGFSQPGEYSLVFNFQGELSGGGLSSIGTTAVDFTVVPEPSTVALILGLGVFGVVSFLRRRSKRETQNLGTE